MLKSKHVCRVLSLSKIKDSSVRRLIMISHKRFSDTILKKYEVKITIKIMIIII